MKNGLLARQRPRGKTRTKLLPSEMNSNCVSQKSSWSDVVSKKKKSDDTFTFKYADEVLLPKVRYGRKQFPQKKKEENHAEKEFERWRVDGTLQRRRHDSWQKQPKYFQMSFCQQSIWFIMHVLLIKFPPYAIRQEVQLCQCFSHTLHQVTLTECCWVIHNWLPQHDDYSARQQREDCHPSCWMSESCTLCQFFCKMRGTLGNCTTGKVAGLFGIVCSGKPARHTVKYHWNF